MAGLSPLAGVGASLSASRIGVTAPQVVSKDGEAAQPSASPAAALKLLQTALIASPTQGNRFDAYA